jgi:hypothetical protein
MKLFIYSLYAVLMGLLPALLSTESLQVIRENAQKHGCTPLGDVKEKEPYLDRITSWYVTSEFEGKTSTMFWCKNPGTKRDFKIVVVSKDKKHPWAQCPSVIETWYGFSPLNLSLIDLSVSGEYDSGGYLFSCQKGKWDVKHSH